ncbi:MAG: hypothetical protein IKA71_03100, partial [Lentisphaeria bacterium]|nr:hypothetical protein [Lentisphaeria bacterium]
MAEVSNLKFYADSEITPEISVAGKTLTDGTVLFEGVNASGEYVDGNYPSSATDAVISGATYTNKFSKSASGMLILDDISIIGATTATNVNGGGLGNSSRTTYVVAGTFTQCHADNTANTNSYGRGSAIHNSGTLYITTKEKVVNGETVTVGTLITGNVGNGLGAGIFSQGELRINGATISENYNAYSGGGMYTNQNTIINDTLFAGNTVAEGKNGGAIIQLSGEVNIYGSTFSGNTASNGGAYNLDAVRTTVTVDGTLFMDNVASANGAAMWISKGASKAEVSASAFIGNSTLGGSGGAIYNAGGSIDSVSTASTLTISGTKFEKNYASANGSAIYAYLTDCTITESFFIGNTAGEHGTVHKNATGSLSISGSTFKENVVGANSTGYGGALFNAVAEAEISGSEFIGNTATNGSAIFNDSTGTDLSIVDSIFTKNSGASGSAIYNKSTGLSIDKSEFTGNTANGNGTIYNTGAGLNITGSEFTGNVVSYNGGAIYNIGANLYVSETAFSGNTSIGTGGAIYNYTGGTNLQVDKSKFTGNFAASGAAIYNTTAKLVISGSTFSKNTAAIIVTDSNKESYTTYSESGAVHTGNTSEITNSVFDGNTSYYGAALYCSSAVTLTVSGSTFTGNKALNGKQVSSEGVASDQKNARGGAVFIKNATVDISGSYFADNESDGAGGAIKTQSGIITISGSTFIGNNGSSGGAISGSNIVLKGMTVTGENGTTVIGNTFSGNISGAGAALEGSFNVSDTLFAYNYSTKNGGAFYSSSDSDGTVSVFGNNTVFRGNTAATNGGALLLRGTTAQITGTVKFETASDDIYLYNGSNSVAKLYVDNAQMYYNGKAITLQVASNEMIVSNSALIFGNTVTSEISRQIGFTGDNNDLHFTGSAAVEFAAGQTFNGDVFIDDDYTAEQTVATNLTISGFTAAGAKQEFDKAYLTSDKKRLNVVTANDGTITVDVAGSISIGETEGFGAAMSFDSFAFVSDYTGAYTVDGDITLTAPLTLAAGATVTNNAVITIDGAAFLTGEENLAKVFDLVLDGTLTVKESGYNVYTTEDGTYVLRGIDAALITADNKTLTTFDGEYYFGSAYNAISSASADQNASVVLAQDVTFTARQSNETEKALILDRVSASNIYSTSSGAAIYNKYSALTVTDSTFSGNTSTKGGGAIYNIGGDLQISDSVFDKNIAAATITDAENNEYKKYANGAAVQITKDAVIENSVFSNNEAYYGAAVYANGNLTLSVSNSSFIGNRSLNGSELNKDGDVVDQVNARGGAIFVNNSSSNKIYLNISGSYFDDNSCTGSSKASGGAIRAMYDTEISISGSTFVNNLSDATGGAISATDPSVLTLTGMTVKTSDSIEIIGNTFANNQAVSDIDSYSNNGGAIDCVEIHVTDTWFYNNSASDNGGALYIGNKDGKYSTIGNNTVFENNQAGNGGALVLYGATARMTGTVKFLTEHDSIYLTKSGSVAATLDINGATVYFNADEIKVNSGNIVTVTNSQIIFGNEVVTTINTQIGFTGTNSLTFNGSAQVNFTVAGGQSLSSANITVNGALFDNQAVTIATGIKDIGTVT